MTEDPDWLERPDGLKLAVRYRAGTGPTLVFLPGYASDMLGTKALALDAWAKARGRAMLRLDYSGCGESEGSFEDGTLVRWRDDVLLAIDTLTTGPIQLVGSSMGGWIALLVALARPERVAAIVGIAAAPDFTDWGFDQAEKDVLAQTGRLERPSDYGPEPMVTTAAFWASGQASLLLESPIAIDCPVRLIQGQHDEAVPWEIALRLARQLHSGDVHVHIVKDGDHRLSRDSDIALLIQVVASLESAP